MEEEIINTNEEVLKLIFDCLVQNGVENTSMRTISCATNLSASSLYYRFKDKDEMILAASFLGLNSITKELFWVAAEKIDNFQELFIALLNNVDARKQSMRLIYQVLSSPKYGKKFKNMTHATPTIIYKYAGMLSERLMCSTEELMPYVGLTVAVIREYAMWENREHTKQKLKFIYDKCLADCCKNSNKK